MTGIIDVHAHYGDPDCFPTDARTKKYYELSGDKLRDIYDRQGIKAACISPMEGLFVKDENELLKANELMSERTEKYDYMYQWAIIHPDMPGSFRQAEELLKKEKCVGLKIHPDAHGYHIKERGNEIFAFCQEHNAILLSHAGDKMSLPEDFIKFADRYPKSRVIIAHLGHNVNGDPEQHIRAAAAASHGNIYVDVSSANSLLNGILEKAVEVLGSEKLLFGTDTPLHNIPMMKARAEYADISDADRDRIYSGNALKLLEDRIKI